MTLREYVTDKILNLPNDDVVQGWLAVMMIWTCICLGFIARFLYLMDIWAVVVMSAFTVVTNFIVYTGICIYARLEYTDEDSVDDIPEIEED